MKKIFLFLLSFFVVNGTNNSLEANTIGWMDSYDEGVQQSTDQSLPMALFFTGSDWCTWCHKLEDEALDTPEFAEAAGDKFVFVKLDYPMKTKQSDEMIIQNRELQQKFDVKSFPTMILVAPDGRTIGVTGYRPGGGQGYADHLIEMAQEYVTYNAQIKKVGLGTLTGTELKILYRKSKEFNLVDDQIKIVKEGMKSDRPHYFMIERYRHLANIGNVHVPEAVTIREQLLKSDPTNRYLTHYQVACIDFDAYADEMNVGKATPDKVVSPLIGYLDNFGEKDTHNLWRINMIIAQVYSDSNQNREALKYAETAYECAPENTRKDISMAIQTFKSK